MTTIWAAIIGGIVSAIVAKMLVIGINDMSEIALSFFKSFWPLLIGGVVFLIIRDIQFFHTLRRQLEKQFQSWLIDKDKELGQFRETYNELLSGHVDEHLTRADRNLKTYRESYEKRLLKIEEALRQIKSGHNI
jgi:uncharacterized integral membrane protein